MTMSAGDLRPTGTIRPPDPGDLDRADEIVGSRWSALSGARVFVTGGTGFVGKWLVASAVEANRRHGLDLSLTLLTRDPQAFRRQVPFLAEAACVNLLCGDVRGFDPFPLPFSHVIHAATDTGIREDPLEAFDSCVVGTRRVLEFAAAAKVRRVLLVSSGAVYGRQPDALEIIPETYLGGPDTLAIGSAYAEGKRAAEWLATAYSKRSLAVTTARCFAFLGPYLPMDQRFAVGNFLCDALAGRPITLTGDGTPMRSYLHGCELAGWLWALLVEGQCGKAYNVGGTQALSMQELAKEVASAAGISGPIHVNGRATPGRVPDRYVPDVSRAMTDLRLPEPWDIGLALRRTVNWLRSVPNVPIAVAVPAANPLDGARAAELPRLHGG